MGAKSKAKSKKGPKGKKARAKAKLEQVWGEQYDDDERKASRIRAGKSRLPHDEKKGNHHRAHAKEFDPLSRNRRGIASTFDSFLERKDKYNVAGGVGNAMGANKLRHIQDVKMRHDNASSDEDSSDDEISIDGSARERSGMNGGASLTSLLNRISGPKDMNKNNTIAAADDNDDDGESEESSIDDAMESNDESETSMQQFDDENSENDNARQEVETDVPSTAVDPYEAHFSKSTMEQSESSQSQATLSNATQFSHVPTLPSLKSSLEVQMSGRLLDTWGSASRSSTVANYSSGRDGKSDEKKQNAIQTTKSWEDFSLGPYQFVRQVLESNWKNVNKAALKHTKNGSKLNIFSPMQMAMYPAVARYADVLITSETHQVRSPRLFYLRAILFAVHSLLTSLVVHKCIAHRTEMKSITLCLCTFSIMY